MAVRLQLENGKIKEYCTFYDDSGSEPIPVTYYTKCGLRWDKCPTKSGGCDHIDCAIDAIEKTVKKYFLLIGFAMGMMTIPTWLWNGDWDGLKFFYELFGIPMILISVYILKARRELIEFKKQGTVNGIKAHKL